MSKRDVLKRFEQYADETAERVNYGIENYRKGNFCITVTDKDGNPVKGAKLNLNQTKHEFKHGANIFMLDELETEEKNQKYKECFADLFNMATLPFYWMDIEPEPGKTRYEKDSPKIYRRPAPDLCIEFCEKHGIEPREHALAYEHLFPRWARDLSVPEIKRALSKRFKEISERYADKINNFEITNEMFWNDKGLSPFYNEEDYVEWCFKEAVRYFPNNELSINDFGMWGDNGRTRDANYMVIERALAKGARIDAIGMQYHMFYRAEDYVEKTKERNYNPRHLFKIMDLYSKFNLPLQVTEITIPAYSWEKEDEELQAEIISRLYPIWFSHKNMEQIIYWNLVDGYAAFAPQGDMTAGENYYHGGLMRFDLSPKPAYYVIKDLFQKTWHTEATVETDGEGKAYFKGFYGDYDVTVNGEKYSIKAIKNLGEDIDYNKKISVTLK